MIKEKPQILSLEYVMKHGLLFDEESFSFESYWEKDINHYEQLFDKPMDMGGKPFNGLVYELFPDGKLSGYTFYKNGYHYGDDVGLYETGELGRFSRHTETENYIYLWYPNGSLKFVKENHRRNVPHYYRSIDFDENGNPVEQSWVCEILYLYDYHAPDTAYDIEFHSNGWIRKIRNTVPSKNILYTEMEFDLQGYPVGFEINPYYCPEDFSAQHIDKFYKLNRYDKECRFEGDILKRRYPSFSDFTEYSGMLAFLNNDGVIEKIMEYRKGIPSGAQYLYYPDGSIKEHYCISKGKEYINHIYWYAHGVISKIILYSRDSADVTLLEFDENGKRKGV